MNIIALRIYGDVLPYIMEGCIEGFQELGHKVRIVDLSGPEDPDEILKNAINDFLPDFLFTINHIGLTRPVLKLLSKLRFPYISWWVDNPLALTTSEDFKSPYLVLFVWDRFYIERLKIYGFDQVYHLPLATNPKVFKKMELTEEEIKQFGCSLSFVGGAFFKGFLIYQEYQRKDAALKNLIDKTLQWYLDNPSLELKDILQNVKECLQYYLPVKEEEELMVKIELMAMSLYRKKIIEGLKDFDLHLYGDEGWLKMLDNGVKFFGRIDYLNLPKLYNASEINLNMTKTQLKTAINQRVFDVAACGGFVLSDFRHDLGRLFEIGKETVFYRDIRDLREKIDYFLVHRKEREEIAQQAQKKVLQEHTYTQRMKDLIEIVESRYLKGLEIIP